MRALITFLTLSAAVACNKTTLSEGNPAGTKAEDSATPSKDPSDDQKQPQSGDVVSIPNHITGSYLHCAEEVPATAEKISVLLGCRIDDAQGKRKVASSFGLPFSYSWQALPSNDVKVAVSYLKNDNRYDAAYLFTANSLTALENAVKSTNILFQVKTPGTAAGEILSGLVPQIKIDSAAVPEPRTTDYEQVRTNIETNVENNPSPPTP